MPPPASPPRIITLILLTATSVLSLNMFLPALAHIAEDLSSDYATVSLSIAGYLATTTVILLILGPLSDRIGRRPVLLVALAVFTAASVICALTENVWTFLFFRMLQSAMATGSALSMTIVRDTHSQQEAAGKIGTIAMAMAVAPMLGPMVGGLIDAAFGWRMIFWFYTVSGIVLIALCWVDLGETRPPRAVDEGARSSRRGSLLREPKFWAFALCTASSRGVFYIFITGTPFVAAAAFGMGTAEIGIAVGSITGGFMLGGYLSSRYAPRFAPSTMMIAGRLSSIVGLAFGLAAISAGWLTPFVLFGSTVLAGFGNGITIPSSNAASLSVRPDLAGTAAGLEGALTVACGAVLTAITGLVLTADASPQALILLMIGASLAGLLAVLWAMRLGARKPDASPV